jgi:putative FmdB family regulatory protein
MPIYAYKCAACGHELDALQKISDAPLTQCPECGAAQLKKQLTAAGFQLKGSGWYATDFRNSGNAAKKPAEGAADASAAAAPAGDGAAANAGTTKPAAADGTAGKSADATGTKGDGAAAKPAPAAPSAPPPATSSGGTSS